VANKETDLLRVPPQSDEAEQALLGAMMLDKEAVSKALQYVTEEAFYKTTHQRIFRAMTQLFNQDQPIDQVSVTDLLKRNGDLEAVGGAYYITGLVESTPSAATAEYYAQVVLEKAILRRLIQTSAIIQTAAYEARDSLDDILEKAEQQIFALSENRLRQGFKSFIDVIGRTYEHIDSIHKKKWHTTGIPTGLSDLDNLTSGFHEGEMIVVAGRPGMGKTALALTIARNAAVDYNIPVGIFSLEMSDIQLALRLLCAEAFVDSQAVRTGKLPGHEWQKLTTHVGRLTGAPLYIDDSASLSMLEIRAKARRLKAEHDVKLIIVDYLQLIKGHNPESRQQEISEISRGLKALSKEIRVPVLALSQLSRAVEMRGGDHRPQLSDLRESGAIEQDADVVLFIYRPIVYARKEKGAEAEKYLDDDQKAEIIVAKQRNGPIGSVNVVFIEKYTRFGNIAPSREEMVAPGF